MRKLQYALMKDCCTFKESLALDLRPPLYLDTKSTLNYGPSIGRRVSLSAKLFSSNVMKSAKRRLFDRGQYLNYVILKNAAMIYLLVKMITQNI